MTPWEAWDLRTLLLGFALALILISVIQLISGKPPQPPEGLLQEEAIFDTVLIVLPDQYPTSIYIEVLNNNTVRLKTLKHKPY